MGIMFLRAYLRCQKNRLFFLPRSRNARGTSEPTPTPFSEVDGHASCPNFSRLEIFDPDSAFAAPNSEFLVVRSRGRISISEKSMSSPPVRMLTRLRRKGSGRGGLARLSARKTASYPDRWRCAVNSPVRSADEP